MTLYRFIFYRVNHIKITERLSDIRTQNIYTLHLHFFS